MEPNRATEETNRYATVHVGMTVRVPIQEQLGTLDESGEETVDVIREYIEEAFSAAPYSTTNLYGRTYGTLVEVYQIDRTDLDDDGNPVEEETRETVERKVRTFFRIVSRTENGSSTSEVVVEPWYLDVDETDDEVRRTFRRSSKDSTLRLSVPVDDGRALPAGELVAVEIWTRTADQDVEDVLP